jgi:hypothetical protein
MGKTDPLFGRRQHYTRRMYVFERILRLTARKI